MNIQRLCDTTWEGENLALSVFYHAFATIWFFLTQCSRNEYMPHEDALLAKYIARRIPQKQIGGRKGNNLYKDLVARVSSFPLVFYDISELCRIGYQ